MGLVKSGHSTGFGHAGEKIVGQRKIAIEHAKHNGRGRRHYLRIDRFFFLCFRFFRQQRKATAFATVFSM